MTSRSPRRLEVAWWLAVTGLCAALLAPLLIVDVPPLLDYPNHLARIFVLASLPHDPVLARFYAAHWSIIPNLALDLAGPPLIRVLPVHVAGRLLIAAAVLLPVFGTIAYSRTIGGRWWSLGAGLTAYNGHLLAGFLNFEIGIGLALLLAAAWLRWRDRNPLWAVGLAVPGALILFACHLMGVVFFGLLVGGAELSRGTAVLLRRSVVLALVFAGPAVLYAASDLRQADGDFGYLPVGEKLRQLIMPFVNYGRALDLVTAGLAFGLPILCLLVRRGHVPRPAFITSTLLLVAFLLAPFAWKGTYALDTRFAVMLGFMLFAGFVPAAWPAWFGRCVAAGMALLFTVRMALLMTAWTAHAADLADLRRVIAPVQPGQAVYVAEVGMAEAPAYWATNPGWRLLSNGARIDEHLGALALIERRAYWPFEFNNVSQQPMETLEPYRSLADRVGSLPDYARASVADVCGFDYVLLIAADAVAPLPAARFLLLAQSGFAALYGVTRCQEDK
jgi:hypothetical protein